MSSVMGVPGGPREAGAAGVSGRVFGSGPEAGEVAGDDGLHDLVGAAVNPIQRRVGTMELMKYQVDGHFVLDGGVGCSPVSVGASNISSNTLPVSRAGGVAWLT
jgi:hypothetical protein